MPLDDLARAVPALALLGLVPGLALAAALVPRWRWWERLAIAPPLSVGCVGMIGLLLHDTHRPFTAAAVGVLLGAVTALSAAVWWRRRGDGVPRGDDMDHGRRMERVVVLAALGAGVLSFLAMATQLRDQPLPLWNDAALHGTVAHAIVAQHDLIPQIPSPADGTFFVRPRAAFEATAALVGDAAGIGEARGMMPLAALCLLLLPLGLACLVLEASGSRRLAALAPVLGVGMVTPDQLVIFGGFPMLVDTLLVAPVVVALVRCLRGDDVRGHVALVTTAIAAMWVTHGLEPLSVAAVGGPLVLATLWRLRSRAAALRLVTLGAGALAGAALVTLLTRVPSIPPGTGPAGTDEAESYLAGRPGLGITQAFDLVVHTNLSAIAIALYAAGVVAVLLRRQLRWALAAHVLLALILADVVFGERLHHLWVVLYPWSTVDRLLSLQYFVLPAVCAVGVVGAVELAATRLRVLRVQSRLSPRAQRLGVTAVLAALGMAASIAGARTDALAYDDAINAHSRLSAADISVLDGLDSRLPPGTRVLTDGEDDAGIWVGALSDEVLYLPKPFVQTHLDDWRVVRLEHACDDPAGARAALSGVDAVYVGGHTAADARHRWDLGCIARLGGLRMTLGARNGGTEAAVFLVDHATTAAQPSR